MGTFLAALSFHRIFCFALYMNPVWLTNCLLQDAERSYKKFKLVAEDVQGKNCLTQFYGMNLTTDKLRSMVKKWQTLIEAHIDVKTTDGYLLRVFCIGFTQKQQHSTKKHCYAQSQQVKLNCDETRSFKN